MNYRKLGRTGLQVSEIGFGGEWLERHPATEDLDDMFGEYDASFTPAQLIHYSLTRPGVASILCGYDTKKQVEEAVAYETASAAGAAREGVPSAWRLRIAC